MLRLAGCVVLGVLGPAGLLVLVIYALGRAATWALAKLGIEDD